MARRISRHLPAIDPQGCERASFDEAPRAEVGLDDMQFALSALQPRATVGPSSAVTIHSTLRRLHAVLRAIEVGHGVLVRLWPCALLARPFRRPLLHLGEDGRPELVPARHCASQSYPAFRAPFAARRSASLAGFFADLLGEPRPFRSAERSWPWRTENLVRKIGAPTRPRAITNGRPVRPDVRTSASCSVFSICTHRLVLRAHGAMNLLDRVHSLLRGTNFLSESGGLRLNNRDSLHVSFERIDH
jgi:hypothetical protein